MKSTKKRMPNVIWCLLLSFLCLFLNVGCSDDSTTSEVSDDWIVNLPGTIEFNVTGGSKKIPLTWSEGVNTEHVACILSEENRQWCDVKLDKGTLVVSVSPSAFARSAAIILAYDKEHKSVMYVNQKSDFSIYFTDESCSELKPGITDAEIEQIPHEKVRELARELKADRYDTEFRVADYRPYQHPSIMAAKNKTAKYTLRDNPTGIYVEKGEELFLYLGNVYEGAQISIIIQDVGEGYGNSQTIALKEGLNRIIAPIGGLIYLTNHVEDNIPLLLDDADDETKRLVQEKTVKAHFIFGKVNGYFDLRKHGTQKKWEEILSNAPWRDIDVVGDYMHLTWNVDNFKGKNVSSNQGVITEILRTVDNLDKMTWLEQDFMGMVKYNRMSNNRVHLCIDYKTSSPNASDYRTVYGNNTGAAEIFCNPDRFPDRLWGPAHEVGHVNQLRPGLKWAGMTEVTNNLLVLYVQTTFGATCKLQKKGDGSVSNPKIEDGTFLYPSGEFKKEELNLYDISKKLIIEGKRAHSLPNIKDIIRETQLVPFWQLKLFFVDALGQKDFYRDLCEYYRNNPSPSNGGKNAGLDQLDFVRQVCRVSGYNMLDFFEKWGFLKAVNAQLDDYGNKIFIITESQVKALKEEIESAGYKKLAPDVHVEDITDETWEEFKQ